MTVLESAWSAVVGASLTAVECAWLKSSTDPTKNIAVDVATTRLSSSSGSDLSVFYAEGRRLPIAHQQEVQGEDFETVPFVFATDAEFEAFEALRDRREPLLLQLPYGDGTGAGTAREQRWVRLGVRSQVRFTYDRMNTAQIRTVDVRVVEVDAPPA